MSVRSPYSPSRYAVKRTASEPSMIAIAVIMLVRVRLPKKIRTKIMTFSKIAAVKIGPRVSGKKPHKSLASKLQRAGRPSAWQRIL